MSDPLPWFNKPASDDAALTYDDLLKCCEKLKQTPVPARFEAGARMYRFLRDSLAAAGQPCTPFPCGIPVILREDMPSELAHLYDTNDRMMKTFIWQEGDEGPKILTLTHPGPDELFKYGRHNDFQRTPAGAVPDRPPVSDRMADYAPALADHPNDGSGPLQVWLDARGLGSPDGGEPVEDQAG